MERAHYHVKHVTEAENYHVKHAMDLEEVLLVNMNVIFAEETEAIHATFATVVVTTHAIYVMEQGTFNIYLLSSSPEIFLDISPKGEIIF